MITAVKQGHVKNYEGDIEKGRLWLCFGKSGKVP